MSARWKGVRVALGGLLVATSLVQLLAGGLGLWIGIPVLYVGLILIAIGHGLSVPSWLVWLAIPPLSILISQAEQRWAPGLDDGLVGTLVGALPYAVLAGLGSYLGGRDLRAAGAATDRPGPPIR